VAAEEAIIPVDASSFSLHGLGKLLDTIQIIEEKVDHHLSVKILATNIDRRTNFCKGVVESLRDRFPENFCETVINTCTKLREAASRGKAIAEYNKSCAGFRDYQDLAMEILIEEPEMKEKGFTLGSLLEAEGLLKSPVERDISLSPRVDRCGTKPFLSGRDPMSTNTWLMSAGYLILTTRQQLMMPTEAQIRL
jgi:hypothetical protein